MANLQSQIDILAKAVVNEHIGFEEYKEKNKVSVSLSEVNRNVKIYNSIGEISKINEGGGEKELKDYKEESYQLEVTKDNKVSTKMFTYSENITNFSGFWLYNDNDKHNYALNDRGKIIISNSVDPYLKRGTFVRRIGLNEGEIGKTQDVKNDERMVYINKDILVNKLLLSYNENTLVIEDSSDDKTWIGDYYVEFSDSEGNDIQLIVKSDLTSIIYPTESDYKVDITGMTGTNFNILYTDNYGNSEIVYVYRSGNINPGEFVNNADTLLAAHLASNVTTIAINAFSSCTRLTQVTMSDSVTTIDVNAFYGCTGLTRVTIPEKVTTINDSAFYGCTGLTQVEILNSIISINTSVFAGCTRLTQVTIPSGVETINAGVFAGCTGLTRVTIPEKVTTINDSAFYECTALKEVIIEGTLKTVGSNAFNTNPESTSIKILKIQCNQDTYGVISTKAQDDGYADKLEFNIVE